MARTTLSTVSAALTVFSSSLITISALMLVTTTQLFETTAYAAARRVCTASTTAACASCTSTKQVYQCKPSDLPDGVLYGTCPALPTGACLTDNYEEQDCSNVDFDCADPPAIISAGGGACTSEMPQTCKKT